jgi:hypothetical protein
MSDAHLAKAEYEALRSELLLLINRSFDIWKWSLVATCVIVGTIVFAVFGKAPELFNIVREEPWLLSAVIMAFASGTVWTLAGMLIDLEETRDRLGAYLAVFHDQDIEPLPATRRGFRYHLWNRIDQYAPAMPEPCLQSPKRGFYGFSRRLGTYLVLQILFALLVFALLSTATKTAQWSVFLIGMTFSLVVGLHLLSLERKGSRSFQYWNQRWLHIRRLSDEEIRRALSRAGLEFSWSKGKTREKR